MSTKLRTDISTMYDYEEKFNSLEIQLLPQIDDVLDTIPVKYPYVPRFCKQQGHMLIWWGTSESDQDIAEKCFAVKNEAQWIRCNEDWKVEKAVVLLWPFEDEIILGAVKYPGYMKIRSQKELRYWLTKVWSDIIQMFGNKKIICPTATYLQCVHLYMNQMRISHEAYHKKMMRKFGFKKHHENNFWIRSPNTERLMK